MVSSLRFKTESAIFDKVSNEKVYQYKIGELQKRVSIVSDYCGSALFYLAAAFVFAFVVNVQVLIQDFLHPMHSYSWFGIFVSLAAIYCIWRGGKMIKKAYDALDQKDDFSLD